MPVSIHSLIIQIMHSESDRAFYRFLFLPKLYTISFISALNDRLIRREGTRNGMNTDFDVDVNRSIFSRVVQRRAKRHSNITPKVRVWDPEHSLDITDASHASTGSISLENRAESKSHKNLAGPQSTVRPTPALRSDRKSGG